MHDILGRRGGTTVISCMDHGCVLYSPTHINWLAHTVCTKSGLHNEVINEGREGEVGRSVKRLVDTLNLKIQNFLLLHEFHTKQKC